MHCDRKGETSDTESEEADQSRPEAESRTVGGGQDYEIRYEAKKTGTSKATVKKAVKKVGGGRKRVERQLGGQKKTQAKPGRLFSIIGGVTWTNAQ